MDLAWISWLSRLLSSLDHLQDAGCCMGRRSLKIKAFNFSSARVNLQAQRPGKPCGSCSKP